MRPNEHQLIRTTHDIVRGDGTSDVNAQALAGELINDVEHLERTQVARLVELKVHGPDRGGGNGACGAGWTFEPGQ